jgi:amino acid adenylation domain-containing protein
LYLGGVQVARGYWDQAALTAERFIDDPFCDTPGARLYKTGDRCRWRADGAIEFMGRLDTQIKIRGFRIEAGEIESTLRQHAAIQHVVVDAKTLGGEAQLVAYLVADTEIPSAELRAHICETLPEHMAPQAYVYLDALPLTPSGKLDRNALPEPQTPESAATYAAPRNEEEKALVELWQQLLQTEPIGINDNFFELGGHSLKAVQLANRISTAFETKLPVRTIFESPTIAALAERITRASSKDFQQIPRTDRTAPPQISFAQKRLWFLDQLDEQRAAYNIPAVVRLDGELDVEAMHRAIAQVANRHETLRTSFEEDDGHPIPRIALKFDVPFEQFDFQSLSDTDREERIDELIAGETRAPINLKTGPLIRAKVIQAAANEYRLLLTIHHIAADGWSLGVMLRELRAFYTAECERSDADLPEPAIQYRDYAAWQNNLLSSGGLDDQLEYWKAQLDEVPVLAIPTDRPRPSVTTHAGATHHFHIASDSNDAINRLSATLGATPFMTLLAGFQALLSRLTGQTDIAVGSPIAGRTDESLEDLIGLFVNTLVLRTDCSQNPSFRQLTERVRKMTMSAFENQDIPFERLVEVLQPDRHLNHNPLFQVMFVLQNAPMPPLELPGATMTPIYPEGDTAKFDLTVVLRESDDGFDGHIEYNTDLFDAESISNFAERYLRVLNSITSNPDLPLAELPVLSAEERTLVLNTWNQTDAPYPDNTTIHALFERHVRSTPDAEAVTMAGTSLTYEELDRLANNIAHNLSAQGVAHEQLIGIYVDRGIETVALVLGVWKAGAAYIPLDPEYPEDRIAFMVHDSKMETVITSPTYIDQIQSLGVSTVLSSNLSKATETATPTDVSGPSSLAYAIYTSGSTGNPKAALIEHRGACNLAEVLRQTFDVGPEYRWLQFAPFSFDAWVADILLTLCNGATLCIAPADERIGIPLANLLEREHINGALFPPSTLSVLPQRPYPHLRTVVSGGEACPASIVNTWSPGRKYINAYGPTEATVISTMFVCEDNRTTDPPIGPPISNFQGYVLDANGVPVPPGTPGELYVGGVGVARGYLNRPELTAERFHTDAFASIDGARMYKTGDLVRHDKNGNIVFIGRTDHQVKLRGFRIELGDIESRLREHDDVEDAICLIEHAGAPNARIIAYAQIGQTNTTAGDLRNHIATILPAHMIPSVIQTVDTLPRTPNGKIDRKALPKLTESNAESARTHVTARTDLERSIADVWTELLNIKTIGIHDNFFDSGGHSLLAVTLVSRLHDCGVTLSLQQVFEHPTIAEMAVTVESAGSSDATTESIAVIQPKGDASPLFALPPASGILFPYFHLAHLLGTDRPFYGLQDPALEPGVKPLESVEAYAAHYATAIRDVQPAGPYNLIGWSLGGTLAFEIARQFESEGESVAFLGLIDTRIPEPQRLGISSRIRAVFQRITVGVNTAVSVPAHVLNGLYVKVTGALQDTPSTTPSVLARLKRRAAAFTLRVVLRRSEFARLLPREYDHLETALPNVTAVPALLRAHNSIASRYQPGTYKGSVSLYRAEDLVRGEREHSSPAFGWEDVAKSVDVYAVPGNHANMMSDPQIQTLAASIRNTLHQCGFQSSPD